MFRHFMMACGVLALLAGSVQAAGDADPRAQAEQKVRKEALAALESLNAALDKLWQRIPMLVTKAEFAARPPKGFGMYEPRPGNVFKPGEPLIVYAEVAGFGYNSHDGVHEIAINGDVAVTNAQGQVLAKMPDFLKTRMQSRRRNKEFMVHMTIELGGAPAGRYVLLGRLKDMTTGKAASFSLPFEIAR